MNSPQVRDAFSRHSPTLGTRIDADRAPSGRNSIACSLGSQAFVTPDSLRRFQGAATSRDVSDARRPLSTTLSVRLASL